MDEFSDEVTDPSHPPGGQQATQTWTESRKKNAAWQQLQPGYLRRRGGLTQWSWRRADLFVLHPSVLFLFLSLKEQLHDRKRFHNSTGNFAPQEPAEIPGLCFI